MSPLRSQGDPGLAITQGYDLSETSPTCHLVPTVDAKKKVGFIGISLPKPGGETYGQEGEAGELWFRGPSVMKSYLARYFCQLTRTKVFTRF